MVFPSYLGARFSHAFFRHDLIHFYSFKAKLRSLLLIQTFLFGLKEEVPTDCQTYHRKLELSISQN